MRNGVRNGIRNGTHNEMRNGMCNGMRSGMCIGIMYFKNFSKAIPYFFLAVLHVEEFLRIFL